jgi:transposase-like protein
MSSRKKKRKRRHYTPEQKADLLRKHIEDKTPVSEICSEERLQPSVFYGWLKTLLANAPTALASPRGSSQEKKQQERIDALEEKVRRKDEVIAEISEEFVRAKKALGEP